MTTVKPSPVGGVAGFDFGVAVMARLAVRHFGFAPTGTFVKVTLDEGAAAKALHAPARAMCPRLADGAILG